MPSIDLDVSTRLAQRNLRQLGDEFEDLSDTLDDVARDGSRGGEKLEDALREVERQAKDTERAVDDIGRGTGGMGRLKGATQEVAQEMGQNLGEAVSSVRDNLSDLGQVGQDTLGGLAGTLAGAGPAGLVGAAALAAGAVGLGLVTAELTKQQEEADKLRDRLSAAYQNAAEEGRKYLDTAAIVAEATDLMRNPERAEEWNRLQADANRLGLEYSTIAAANAGDIDAQRQVMEALAAASQLTAEEQSKLGLPPGFSDELNDIKDRWGLITGETQRQIDANKTLAEVVANLNEGERAQIQKTRDADQQRWEAYAAARAQVTGDVTQKVTMQVDDSAVRNYKAPELVIRTRLGAPKDVTWQ